MKKIIFAMALSILFAFTTSAQNIHYERGYASSLGAAVSVDQYRIMGNVQTYQGYNFGNGISMGVLTGIGHERMPYGKGISVPLRVESSYHFLDENISPFISAGLGVHWVGDIRDMSEATTSFAVGLDINKWQVFIGARMDTYERIIPAHVLSIGMNYCF